MHNSMPRLFSPKMELNAILLFPSVIVTLMTTSLSEWTVGEYAFRCMDIFIVISPFVSVDRRGKTDRSVHLYFLDTWILKD
jgi:hypothetical protein